MMPRGTSTLIIRAYLKGDHIESLPILHDKITTFRDPRTNEEYECYMVDLRALTEEEWVRIHHDMRSRFVDCPPEVADLKAVVRSKGGMPIRADRVESVILTASLRELI